MFTGIVTDLGTVREVQPIGGGHDLRLVIGTSPGFLAEPAPAALGASIACSGVCLTVVALGTAPKNWFDVEISAETAEYNRMPVGKGLQYACGAYTLTFYFDTETQLLYAAEIAATNP